MESSFRNAEASDVEDILAMVDGDALGGAPIIDHVFGKGHADGMKTMRALVGAGDTEYGYEQATLAEDGEGLAGLFIGYPRDALAELGPRTLKAAMTTKSPLSWPGLIARHAKITRLEPPPPPGAYVLALVCARRETRAEIVSALLGEALTEASAEECSLLIVNLLRADDEYEQLLRRGGFEEKTRKPIGDSKLSAALGSESIVQFARRTGYTPAAEPEP